VDELEENAATLKEKMAKNSRSLAKNKIAKEEADLKVIRLESELHSFKTLLNDKTKDYKETISKNEILEEKNAKLRKETIMLARERNDADFFAKDKCMSANVKSHKIKVLKSQL
jgi:chromosome segregation ATPase